MTELAIGLAAATIIIPAVALAVYQRSRAQKDRKLGVRRKQKIEL